MGSAGYSRSFALTAGGVLLVALLLGGALYLSRDRIPAWGPSAASEQSGDRAAAHSHAGHDHSHAGHDEANSIELSEQARNSIGLQLMTISLEPFVKTITVPGVVAERPGRTAIEVAAPMAGVVTRIGAVQGEAVRPGDFLAEMRLMHEELVQAQGDLLQTVESLDVLGREIARIESLTREGAIAGRTLIDLNYEKQKAEAVLRAQRQTLLLHGLSEEQVASIIATRHLLPSMTVVVPHPPESEAATDRVPPPLQIEELRVTLGQHVDAGEVLFILADHEELFIEGRAFEKDIQAISSALVNQWDVAAVVESRSPRPEDIVSGLKILYMANRVDPDARTFRFYLTLPNQLLRETTSPAGRKFLDWEFKPGQRVQVRVPTERWEDKIVLPIDAVATEGTESFVFQANGDHFDRRPVHVEYRDPMWVVIANDGSLFPGDIVAKTAAFQLQTAIKNKSGGAIDPHAGHNH